MAIEVIKTVKPSGGDYTSLSAWEAGQQGDLPTLDEIHTAECYSMEDTTAVLIDGWTTDATRYIKIYTPASERHDGKWNDSKYRLIVDDTRVFSVNYEHVRIEGLQIRQTSTSWNEVVQFYAAPDSYIGYSIIESSGTGRNVGIRITASSTVTVYNSVIGPLNLAAGIYAASSSEIVNIYNSTIAKTNGGAGIKELAGSTVTVKNTTVADTGDDFDFAGSGSIDYCASDDGDGTNAQPLSATRSNDFVDFANDDFHVVSGSVQVDNGVSDPGSGLYSDDIEGNSRSGSWDIGAFELAAGASITKIVAETYQFLESTLRLGTSARVMTETYQLSEGLIRKLAAVRIVAETVQFGENVLKWLGIFKLVNEATQWGEGILRRSGFVKLVNETVQWGEGLIRRLASIHLIDETVQLSENLIRKLTSIRIISETVQWGESLLRKMASVRLVTETVSFIENTIYQRGIKRIVNETLTWVESIIKVLGVSQILDLFKPQLKSLKQRYQLKSLKQKYQLKSLKQRYQIKWLG